MDAFIKTTTFQYSAFLKTGNGDIWRVWFDGNVPLMERCIPDQVPAEVRKELRDDKRTAD